MMDWNKIEKEFNQHAESLVRRGSNRYSSSLYEMNDNKMGNENKPMSNLNNSNSYNFDNNQSSIITINTLSNDINELRNSYKQQLTKLNLFEINLSNFNNDIESSNKIKEQIIDRMESIEFGINDTRKSYAEITRSNTEVNNKVKKIESHIINLDESINLCLSKYTTKESFSSFIDNCYEQIRTLTAVCDTSKQKSNQSITLFESLIHALFDLKGVDNNGFRVDFLTSLSGEIHKEQVSRLLLEAIRSAIDFSVQEQLKVAVNKFNQSISSMIKELHIKQEQSSSQLYEKLIANYNENNELFEEKMSKFISDKMKTKTNDLNDLESKFNKLERDFMMVRDSNEKLSHENTLFRENFSTQRNLIDNLIVAQQNSQYSLVSVDSIKQEQLKLREKFDDMKIEQLEQKTFFQENNSKYLNLFDKLKSETSQQVKESESLKVKIEEITEQYQVDKLNIEKEHNILKQELHSTVAATVLNINNKIESTQDIILSNKKELGSDISNSINELNNSIEKNNKNTESLINNIKSDLEEKLSLNIESIDSFVDTFDEYKHEMDNKLVLINDESKHLNNIIINNKSLSDEIDIKIDSIYLELQEKNKNHDETILSLELNLKELNEKNRVNINDISSEYGNGINKCVKDIELLQSEINEMQTNTDAKMTSFLENLAVKLSDFEHDMLTDNEEYKNENNVTIREINEKLASLSQSIMDFNISENHNTLVERLKIFEVDLISNNKTLNFIKHSTETNKKDFDVTITEITNKVANNESLIDLLSNNLTDNKNNFEILAETVNQNNNISITNFQKINQLIVENKESVDSKFDAILLDISNVNKHNSEKYASTLIQLNEIKTQFEVTYKQLELILLNKIDDTRNEVLSIVNSVSIDVNSKVEKNIDNVSGISLKLITLTNDVDMKYTDLNNNINNKIHSTIESLSDLAQQLFEISKLQEKQQFDTDNLANNFSKLKTQFKENIDNSIKKVTTESQIFSKDQQRINEEIRYDHIQLLYKIEILEQQLLQLEDGGTKMDSSSHTERYFHQDFAATPKVSNEFSSPLSAGGIYDNDNISSRKGNNRNNRKLFNFSDNKIISIESEIANIKNSISNISISLEANKNTAYDLSDSLNQLKQELPSSLEQFSTLVHPLVVRVDTIESNNFKEKIEAIRNDFSKFESALENSKTETVQHDKRINDLSQSLFTSISENVKEFGSIELKHNNVTKELLKFQVIEKTLNVLSEMPTAIQDLYKKVTILNEANVKNEVLKEEIQNITKRISMLDMIEKKLTDLAVSTAGVVGLTKEDIANIKSQTENRLNEHMSEISSVIAKSEESAAVKIKQFEEEFSLKIMTASNSKNDYEQISDKMFKLTGDIDEKFKEINDRMISFKESKITENYDLTSKNIDVDEKEEELENKKMAFIESIKEAVLTMKVQILDEIQAKYTEYQIDRDSSVALQYDDIKTKLESFCEDKRNQLNIDIINKSTAESKYDEEKIIDLIQTNIESFKKSFTIPQALFENQDSKQDDEKIIRLIKLQMDDYLTKNKETLNANNTNPVIVESSVDSIITTDKLTQLNEVLEKTKDLENQFGSVKSRIAQLDLVGQKLSGLAMNTAEALSESKQELLEVKDEVANIKISIQSEKYLHRQSIEIESSYSSPKKPDHKVDSSSLVENNILKESIEDIYKQISILKDDSKEIIKYKLTVSTLNERFSTFESLSKEKFSLYDEKFESFEKSEKISTNYNSDYNMDKVNDKLNVFEEYIDKRLNDVDHNIQNMFDSDKKTLSSTISNIKSDLLEEVVVIINSSDIIIGCKAAVEESSKKYDDIMKFINSNIEEKIVSLEESKEVSAIIVDGMERKFNRIDSKLGHLQLEIDTIQDEVQSLGGLLLDKNSSHLNNSNSNDDEDIEREFLPVASNQVKNSGNTNNSIHIETDEGSDVDVMNSSLVSKVDTYNSIKMNISQKTSPVINKETGKYDYSKYDDIDNMSDFSSSADEKENKKASRSPTKKDDDNNSQPKNNTSVQIKSDPTIDNNNSDPDPNTAMSSHIPKVTGSLLSSRRAGSTKVSQEESVQCVFCLRRISKDLFAEHNKTCELRTELCPNNCGTRVRLSKMDQHKLICEFNNKMSNDADSSSSFSEEED